MSVIAFLPYTRHITLPCAIPFQPCWARSSSSTVVDLAIPLLFPPADTQSYARVDAADKKNPLPHGIDSSVKKIAVILDSCYLSSRCFICFQRALQHFAQLESVMLSEAPQTVIKFHTYPSCKLNRAPGFSQGTAVDALVPTNNLR